MFNFDVVFKRFLNAKATFWRNGVALQTNINIIVQAETTDAQVPETVNVKQKDSNIMLVTHSFFLKNIPNYKHLLGDKIIVTSSETFDGEYAIVEYPHAQRFESFGYSELRVRDLSEKKIGDSATNNVARYRFGED